MLNDFNRNTTPSNHESKEFKIIYQRIEEYLNRNTTIFDYEKDETTLRTFIKKDLGGAKSNAKIKINKNNFIPIYLRWIKVVKKLIDVDWDQLEKSNILDSDFFLADLFVDDNNTIISADDQSITSDLFVMFENGGYKIAKENLKQMFDSVIRIRHKDTYELFRKNYKRPPVKAYQEYIIQRRDLIVPQNVRERKGAYFTPRIWVELSQQYMADYFGEDYQDEYYIRDCAAGTGNLLAGPTNKYNIYASTLDMADVNVMKENIKHHEANLLESHVFQFDFLNDGFDKIPQSLQDIIKDPEKRKKLIFYINPPYAESGNSRTMHGNADHKAGTSKGTMVHNKYGTEIGYARNELFTQFLYRIYKEIPNCKIANFSKLKNLQGSKFQIFRRSFLAKLEKIFLVPADTFDNVKGQFPIGFFIWDSEKKEAFKYIQADIYDRVGNFIGFKNIYSYDDNEIINKWITQFEDKSSSISIGMMSTARNDFQNKNLAYLGNNISAKKTHAYVYNYTKNNIFNGAIYLAVHHCIEANRLNDRDQFLRPLDGREKDSEFQNDCLTFTLFHGQNRITSEGGMNHRIPFTESEVNAKERFTSHFMSEFLKPLCFSPEAQEVFNAGKALWGYYHQQKFDAGKYLANASLYQIREYFQGRNEKTRKMNNKSSDETYTQLIGNLRSQLKNLGDKIAEKVYQYEFLKK